jgi:hypothetical protein
VLLPHIRHMQPLSYGFDGRIEDGKSLSLCKGQCVLRSHLHSYSNLEQYYLLRIHTLLKQALPSLPTPKYSIHLSLTTTRKLAQQGLSKKRVF